MAARKRENVEEFGATNIGRESIRHGIVVPKFSNTLDDEVEVQEEAMHIFA